MGTPANGKLGREPRSSRVLAAAQHLSVQRPLAKVVVIIVGFKNPDDLVMCLGALSRLDSRSNFEVVVAENGGAVGVTSVLERLRAVKFLLPASDDQCHLMEPRLGSRVKRFKLLRPSFQPSLVHVAAMEENLGYAGAINACVRCIDDWPGWEAVWILNPDTKPMPSALWELEVHAERYGFGMVGSRLCTEERPEHLRSCGLKWSKFRGQTGCVGLDMSTQEAEQENTFIEQQLDAPSGASLYVTRDLMQRVGLMDESYFLYFEDLDWGIRAKAIGTIGYAHRSVVRHLGGSTIGSAQKQTGASYLATYLEFRNRILFVRKFYPTWLAWTVATQVGHAVVLALSCKFDPVAAAVTGLLAGLRGETGRPEKVMARHRMPASQIRMPS